MIPATRHDEARWQVSFRLRAPAARAYVYGDFCDGSSAMIEMKPDGADRWRATLPVSPGTYHYRFYVDDGRLLTYCPAGGSCSDGMDQTLVVPAALEQQSDAQEGAR